MQLLKGLAVVMMILQSTLAEQKSSPVMVQGVCKKGGCAGSVGPNIPVGNSGAKITPYVQGSTKTGITGGGIALTIPLR